MREDTPTPDASERHLALRASLAREGHAPPLAAKTALAAFDARAPSDEPPSACLTEYTLRVDAPAHDDPARNERTLRAMSEPLFSEGIRGVLQDDPRSLETWMGALLGLSGRASLRTREGYARGGSHTYSTLEGALAERWTAGFSAEVFALHPVIRGARWYFDAIFLHPFDDGNARLARALLVCSIEGRVDLAPLVWLPKRPGSAEDFWRFVTVCALQSVARDRRRYHERTLR